MRHVADCTVQTDEDRAAGDEREENNPRRLPGQRLGHQLQAHNPKHYAGCQVQGQAEDAFRDLHGLCQYATDEVSGSRQRSKRRNEPEPRHATTVSAEQQDSPGVLGLLGPVGVGMLTIYGRRRVEFVSGPCRSQACACCGAGSLWRVE